MLFTRPDGTRAKDLPPYRRIMPFIMRGKNESVAYFEQELDLAKTEAFIAEWNRRGGKKITLYHVFMWASIQVLAKRPRLNRFIAGSQIYQRDGIWISTSAKKAMHDDSPVVVIKKRYEPGPFAQLVDSMYEMLGEGRSDKKSHVDQELGILLKLPQFLLRFLIKVQIFLDAWNLLPQAFIKPDPLYASFFVANLGSLKMNAVHHHLYEYGNIPIFACIGKKEKVPVYDESDNLVPRLTCKIKYTYDERVEDGLYCAAGLDLLRTLVEDPEAAGATLPEERGPREAPISEVAPRAALRQAV